MAEITADKNARKKRRRVPAVRERERREIVTLFDLTRGDCDHVAERTGVDRLTVLAVTLHHTRREMGRDDGASAAYLVRKAG